MSDESLRSYLFVVDSSQHSLDDAILLIDSIKEVVNWLKILPDAAVLTTTLKTKELNGLLNGAFSGKRYMIAELRTGTKDGWLPKSVWTYINTPKPA